MQEGYNPLWSYNFVPSVDDDLPELATNEDWRGIMVRARKAYGWSQSHLADQLKVSQAIISKIESGETSASKLIQPICQLLSIPQPLHLTDPDERAWMQLGRVLRAKNPDQARAALQLVETMVKALDGAESAEIPGPSQSPKQRK
jgi:transcriptional regulator with XRE-family HTH domain